MEQNQSNSNLPDVIAVVSTTPGVWAIRPLAVHRNLEVPAKPDRSIAAHLS